jgi:hypothetical protein
VTKTANSIWFVSFGAIADSMFLEKNRVSPEAIYEYVVATIDIKEQKLKLYWDKQQFDEFDYKLF